MTPSVQASSSFAPLPAFTRRLVGFQVLNAVNFTIALGSPMVLAAKLLGAGEAAIGLLLALTPLFVFLQIPSARLAESWGYRRLMMAGWRTRSYMMLGMAPLPLLVGHVPSGWLLAAMIALLLGFNVIRGFASGAWYPWLAHIVPEAQRGRYLGRENFAVNAGTLVAQVVCGWFLGSDPPAWHYTVLFVVSFAAGWCSVWFFERVPCPPPRTGPAPAGDGAAAMVRRAWRDAPFRRITRYTMLQGVAMSGVGGFLVVFLRDLGRMGAGTVVYVMAASTLGSLVTAALIGRSLDLFGSRPVIRLAGLGQIALLAFWAVVAAGPVRITASAAAAAAFILGMLGTAHGLAVTRLTLAFCPRDDLTRSMAVNQVLTCVTAGLGAVLWGAMIEWMRGLPALAGSPGVAFAAFFATGLVVMAASQNVLGGIHEPHSVAAGRLIVRVLWHWPLRVLGGLWLGEDRSAHR
ncbi:MAG: MFS transporter [Lentisphaerae bacterium]|nr:MFS transporter [Lentisphaerota bacterium]